MNSIFSHGKLLLTSEYVVLDGALALAVPTRLGQEFSFTEIDDAQSVVLWEAYHQGRLWLSAKIDYQVWEILETNIPQSADFILKVLKNVQQLSSDKFQQNQSYYLKTNLQFPADFGLGSSSTLMNNLAEWAGVDAYLLNDYSLGGSGYDIAVAKAKQPILFQIKENERRAEVVDFSPEFAEDLLFVHLNQKQDSREGISLYRSKEKPQNLVDLFSEITKKILETKDINTFSELLTLHETELSKFLGIPTAKDKYFADCPVFIKSLGAWGGDFILTQKFSGYEDYFRQKGFSTLIDWQEMIKK